MDEYKKIAAKLVALKSVSADPTCEEDCKKTAEFLKDLLISYGFDAKTIDGYGNPVVFGSYVVDPSLETCLIYGHYDVQPAAKEDGWNSDPFEMVEKDGRLYGRGIMDDKCQFIIHVLTIGRLIKEKKLKYNIKFIFEGSEEIGSPLMDGLVDKNKDLLSCDFVLFSDDEMVLNKPTLELSARGIVNFELTIKTSSNEVHSGIFGGAIPSATYEMSKFINNLLDENNRIKIDGIYDDVEEMDTTYNIPFDLEKFKKNSGAKVLVKEPEFNFYQQTGLRPAITVTGMYGGYIQEGNKSIIPNTATAKFNMRIVKNQDPRKIATLVKDYVKKILPDYVEYDLSINELAHPFKTDKDNKYLKKTEKVLIDIFGEKPYYKYVGGTEPILIYFQEILQKPIVAVPFANDDGYMHGANENFKIENIEKGLEFSERFFGETK